MCFVAYQPNLSLEGMETQALVVVREIRMIWKRSDRCFWGTTAT